MKGATVNIRSAKPIISDDLTYYATSVEVLSEDRILQRSIENTISSISPVRSAQRSLAHKTAITNTKGKYTAIITIPHSLRKDALDARQRSSSSLWRSSETVRTSIGTPNAT